MNTEIKGWCVGVVEAAVLLAVTSVPVFVNFYGFRVFELGKGSLVVSLALLVALAGAIALIEDRLSSVRVALRQPLVVAAILMWLATLVATAFSVAPRISLLGSQERAEGLVALTAGLLMFGGALGASRADDRRGRIVGALVGGSVPVALFALIQAAGVAALPGKIESTSRAFSMLSNPIFLGSYLMLLVPITVSQTAAAWREKRSATGIGLAIIALLQVGGIAVSASRGPGLGLAAGVVVLLLAWAASRGQRGVAALALVLAVAGALFLGVLNMPDSPLSRLADVPWLGRYAEIGETGEGSQETRLLVWDAVDRLVRASEPQRLLVGNGPETLKYVLLPHTGPNVGGKGQSDRLVDRAHSVPLDDLVTTGLLGAAARLAVFGAWLYSAALALGLLPTRRRRRALAAALAVGALAGAATLLVPSLARYAGALAALGLLAGLLVFLVLAALGGRPDSEADSESGTDTALAAGLLAAGAAAVAESAVGIETIVPQLVFWVLAGVVAALALPGAGLARPTVEHAPAPRPASATATESGTVTLSWSGGGAALGLAFGAAMGILLYDFLAFGDAKLPATIPTLIVLLVGAWLAGLVAAAAAREALTGAGSVALVGFAAYAATRALTLAATGDAAMLFAATTLFLVVAALVGGWWVRDRYLTAPIVSGVAAIAYPLLAIVAVAALFTLAVRPVEADIYFQSALVNFEAARTVVDESQIEFARQRYADAETLFERAHALNPSEDTYYLKQAEEYALLMSLSPDLETQLHWFNRAQAEIGKARDLDPAMPYHLFNHGHMQLVFAQMVQDEEQRTRLAADAEINLQQAFDAVPYDPHVANELALAKLLQGDNVSGVALLEYVRDNLDDENALTWQLLARAYGAAGASEEAEQALQRAMELGGGSPEDMIALGDAARQADDLQAASEWYERAIASGAQNWAVYFNLGLLYRDLGRTQQALETLNVAMQLAPSQDAALQIQTAVQGLLENSAGIP
ncbi:MAG: hypothetical protein ACK2T6_04480 [Anaerolineae bacterium]